MRTYLVLAFEGVLMRRLSVLVLSLASVLVACGGTSAPNPFTTQPEPGIRREVFHVSGTHPGDNPVHAAATPTALDVTQVVRYRQDVASPVAAHAILVAMPGFLAGASTFDGLARTLVRRGAARGVAVEVWAIDRRANLLEDTYGLELAEASRTPSLASDYYRSFQPVDGHIFEGIREQSSLAYMSEWGLATHAEDLRRVIALVPEVSRRGHVFLLGHSLGGSFAEAYGAWTFESDARRGAEELAGFILIDGILGTTPSTENEYLTGSSAGGYPAPGLDGIRDNQPYTALPLLGVSALVNAEIAALHAHFDPTGVIDDSERDNQFSVLFGADMPRMTNLAAMGLAFDAAHEPLPFVRATIGTLVGPTEGYSTFFTTDILQRPSDLTMTYSWVDGPTAPGEFSSAADLAHAMVHGRSNLSEWYFPSRLALDLAAVGGANIPTTGFPASYGLRAFGGSSNDAPVLCVVAELVGDIAACDAIRTRVAPTVGTGRPSAGADRGTAGTDSAGFRVLDVTTMAHIDPVLARDLPTNPVPGKIEAFIDENTASGAVVIPVQPSPAP